MSEQTITGNILHQWTMQEYSRHDRGTLWHILMITVGLILVIYALVTDNFLFALIIILFGIILFLQSHQDAPQVPFAITELGIVVGARFYAYSEFESFYIIMNPLENVSTLFLDTKSALRPTIRVPLLDNDPLEIRTTLREFLVEDIEKEEEPLSETVARRWKIH